MLFGGLIIVHWIVFRLLIIERVPYNLDASISLWQMFIILFIMLGSLLEVKLLLDQLQKRESKSQLRLWLAKYVLRYYVDALAALQEVLLDNSILCKILISLKNPLVYFFHQGYATVAVTFYFSFYARIIVTTGLCIDIFYLHRIFIFYHLLYFLVFPLIFTSILSLLHKQSTTTLHQLEQTKVTLSETNAIYTIVIRDPALCDNAGSLILRQCYQNLQVLNLIAIIHQIKRWYYFLLFQCILSLIFLISWAFAFFRIIYITQL